MELKHGSSVMQATVFAVIFRKNGKFERNGTGTESHNLVGDNFFTDFGAIKQLLARQMTYCGTVPKNKRAIPLCMLEHKQRPIQQFLVLKATLCWHPMYRGVVLQGHGKEPAPQKIF